MFNKLSLESSFPIRWFGTFFLSIFYAKYNHMWCIFKHEVKHVVKVHEEDVAHYLQVS
jgi:hypothetical protein